MHIKVKEYKSSVNFTLTDRDSHGRFSWNHKRKFSTYSGEGFVVYGMLTVMTEIDRLYQKNPKITVDELKQLINCRGIEFESHS